MSEVMQLCEFVFRYKAVFNHFPIDATDKSIISSDRYRIQTDFSQHPLSFFTNTPFKWMMYCSLFLIGYKEHIYILRGRIKYTFSVLGPKLQKKFEFEFL